MVKQFIDDGCYEPELKWKYEFCADDGATDAYGDIKFLGLEKTSKYVRVSRFTQPDALLKLLFDKRLWRLKQPGLLISITGGTKLDITPAFKEHFCQGLVKAAMNTSESNCFIARTRVNLNLSIAFFH